MEASLKPDRTAAPAVLPINKVQFPKIEQLQLSNGTPVYLIQYGGQDIIDLRLVINKGGKSFETHSGLAGMTSKMLTEGTKNHTGYQLAQQLDEYGAFLHPDSGYEAASFHLTCLEKHLPNVLPLVEEVMVSPTFPEDEFVKLKERTIHQLEVEEQNTAFVARREFSKLMYGPDHPYGDVAGAETIKALKREWMVEFHERCYGPEHWSIVISGKFDQERLLENLETIFGKYDRTPKSGEPLVSKSENAPILSNSGLHYFEKADSKQSTVRLGHLGFKREHPDFHKMQVVNTILGGYFGSRLMKNIREDKGFTYNIGSAWISFRYAGIFLIQTDVGNEYIKVTLEEIKKELNKLIEEGVTENELELVKNYILGRSISARETPSQINEIVSNYLIRNQGFDTLDEKFEIIQSITTADIKALTQKYFKPEDLLIVISGKMEEKKEEEK